jgi:hypothetical protein
MNRGAARNASMQEPELRQNMLDSTPRERKRMPDNRVGMKHNNGHKERKREILRPEKSESCVERHRTTRGNTRAHDRPAHVWHMRVSHTGWLLMFTTLPWVLREWQPRAHPHAKDMDRCRRAQTLCLAGIQQHYRRPRQHEHRCPSLAATGCRVMHLHVLRLAGNSSKAARPRPSFRLGFWARHLCRRGVVPA